MSSIVVGPVRSFCHLIVPFGPRNCIPDGAESTLRVTLRQRPHDRSRRAIFFFKKKKKKKKFFVDAPPKFCHAGPRAHRDGSNDVPSDVRGRPARRIRFLNCDRPHPVRRDDGPTSPLGYWLSPADDEHVSGLGAPSAELEWRAVQEERDDRDDKRRPRRPHGCACAAGRRAADRGAAASAARSSPVLPQQLRAERRVRRRDRGRHRRRTAAVLHHDPRRGEAWTRSTRSRSSAAARAAPAR